MLVAKIIIALILVLGILTIPANLAAVFARRFDRVTRRYPRAFSWASGALLGAFVGFPLAAMVFLVTHNLWAAEASEAVLALGCAYGWRKFDQRFGETAAERKDRKRHSRN
jgi:hypothetical protein